MILKHKTFFKKEKSMDSVLSFIFPENFAAFFFRPKKLPLLYSMLGFRKGQKLATEVCLETSSQVKVRERSILAGVEKNAPESSLEEDNSRKSNHKRLFQGLCEKEDCKDIKCPSSFPSRWENKAHLTHVPPSLREKWKVPHYISSQDVDKKDKIQNMIQYEKPRNVERSNIEVDHRTTGYAQKNQARINECWDQEESKEK